MGDVDVDFEDLKENKFAHLLKPIRDLQDNFNVDLAHELEEYLEQLENAQFAFEGSRHVTVDFAEAALLIQGSALVFSKKVEYLYNLTYQALEAVKGRRRQLGPDGQPLEGDHPGQPAAGARGRAAPLARVVDEEEEDSIERVWLSEPFLKECEDIDLAPGEGAMPNAGSAVRPPAALIALEDHSQSAASTAGGKGDGDAGVYRLQQCVVHSSGALLLDLRDGDLYDEQLRFVGPQPKNDKSLEQLIEAHRWEQPTRPMPQPASQTHMPGAEGQRTAHGAAGKGMDVDPGQLHDYDNDEGGGYGCGGDWPSDNEGAPAAAPEDGNDMEPKAADRAAVSEGTGAATAEYADGRPQRRQAAVSAAAAQAGDRVAPASIGGGQQGDGEAAEEEEEAFDPYKPLDPTAKSRLSDRPLVVRRPRKMQRSGKAAAPASAAATAAAAACGLLLPEFGYCLSFLRAARADPEPREKRVHEKGRADRVARLAPGAAAPVFDARDAAAAVAADEAAAEDPAEGPREPQAEQPYGFDDDDNGGDYGGGGGASDLDDDVGAAAVGAQDFGGDAGGMGDAWHNPPGAADDAEARGWPGGRGFWDGRVPPMGGLGGSEDGMPVDGEEPSYEELCRAHMESMLLAAAAREVQSDLARRVSSWRQRIDPVLKAEESRPAFDIQNYGELILSRLSALKLADGAAQEEKAQLQQQQQQPEAAAGAAATGAAAGRQCVSFSLVAVDLEKFEVSRMFSALLQLINTRNVAIYKADASGVPEGDVPDEPLALELLSADMYHKTMGARLAAPQQGGAAAADSAEHEDGENRGTQPARGKAGGGRGKAAGGGGAKRAKRPAAEPLGEAIMDD